MDWEHKVIKDTCIVGLFHLLFRHMLFFHSLCKWELFWQLSPQLSPSVLTLGNHMNFFETKRAHRVASEYHPNHSHMERGDSKTNPVGLPAASCQHPVLRNKSWDETWRECDGLWPQGFLPLFLHLNRRPHPHPLTNPLSVSCFLGNAFAVHTKGISNAASSALYSLSLHVECTSLAINFAT